MSGPRRFLSIRHPWLTIAAALCAIFVAANDAHPVAIHTVHVDLNGVVERAELIAVVAPSAQPPGANRKSLEFDLVKILHASTDSTKVPKRFAIGPSFEGAAFISPPRPDPSGKLEAPLVFRYNSSLDDKQLAADKQVIVFLVVTRNDQQPFRFAVDNAIESVSRLEAVREAIARLKRPSLPSARP